ncbi:MAG: YggS family pyridoxal phosphate-dependent enzyme [Thermaerobacter sp.]|jgi:pyridoxal phosphate enzyme (YggS family)|nr:YggS family pyridoxal phosphate-dependent enzyme [Thermaerobacter sp.]
MEDVAAKLEEVRARIIEAARRGGHDPGKITLVAVTKGVEPERIRAAWEAGVTDWGENRVQEAARKRPQVPAAMRLHLIGTLQRNKAARALEMAGLIHSLDRLSLARELERSGSARQVAVRVLVQVNTSGEAAKHGVSPAELPRFLESLRDLSHVAVEGLMTIGPREGGEPASRACFAALRELAAAVRQEGFPWIRMEHLSMGMSADYATAVEEGADLVRIGTAIFGRRA